MGDEQESYSYSSSYSSIQTGGAEPMTSRRQTYQRPDGQIIERMSHSIGDRSVTRSLKNNKANQTLHNMTEADLGAFNERVDEMEHQSRRFFASPFQAFRHPESAALEEGKPAGLPQALEQDLKAVKMSV